MEAETQREEEMEARLEAEAEAQQERLRAERFAEQLRALGINPGEILTK